MRRPGVLRSLPGLLAAAVVAAGLHGLPLAVVWAGLQFVEGSHVAETWPTLGSRSGALLGLSVVLQGAAVALRTFRDPSWRRPWLRYLKLVTAQGWAVLATGLFLVATAVLAGPSKGGVSTLCGLLGAFTVGAFYLMLLGSALLAAVVSGGGAGSSRGRRASAFAPKLDARFSPSRITAGDSAELLLEIDDWRVPPGYVPIAAGPVVAGSGGRGFHRPWTLLLRQEGKKRASVTASAQLRRSRRGRLKAFGENLFLRDVFGLTQVPLPAPRRPAFLEVLPPVAPCRRRRHRPRPSEGPDLLSRLHRRPETERFDFREYRPGDPLRRVHWPLSIKHGRLLLRLPESRPASRTVTVVLDTFRAPSAPSKLSSGADKDLLDALVRTWLGVGRALAAAGERVELVVADSLPAEGGDERWRFRSLAADQSFLAARRLGSRVRWQSALDLDACRALARGAVVVSGRLDAWPSGIAGFAGRGQWLFVPPPALRAEADDGPSWGRTMLRGLLSLLLRRARSGPGLLAKGRSLLGRRRHRRRWQELVRQSARRRAELVSYGGSVEVVDSLTGGALLLEPPREEAA